MTHGRIASASVGVHFAEPIINNMTTTPYRSMAVPAFCTRAPISTVFIGLSGYRFACVTLVDVPQQNCRDDRGCQSNSCTDSGDQREFVCKCVTSDAEHLGAKRVGGRAATVAAPARVLSAACAAVPGTETDMAAATWLRYMAVPMLPRTAIPRAPPSSELVSKIDEAAPARSEAQRRP